MIQARFGKRPGVCAGPRAGVRGRLALAARAAVLGLGVLAAHSPPGAAQDAASPAGGAALTPSADPPFFEGRQTDSLDALRRAMREVEKARSGAPEEPARSPRPNEGADAPKALTQRGGDATAEAAAAAQGVSATEIRFGMAAPLSGPARDLGRTMRIGIETAFNQANESGGVNGRSLKLIAADDGYEPSRTPEAMARLYDADKVFGFIGNVGTPTAAAALPIALARGALFFAPLTGAGVVRRDPPDRYVFNYRPSYAEETEATIRYLVNVRRLRPEQIAVFAQDDAYGDSGFGGVERAMRRLAQGGRAPNVLRMTYKRNSVDVDNSVAQFRAQRGAIKAVVMVATSRAAARFIEKTRDLAPDLIYTNVSFVGSTALADELSLLGRKYATGIIVTQVVPAVEASSSAVMEYKNALAKHFPGEKPDYISLEGYVAAKLLIEGLKRAGPALTTETLVDALEGMRGVDLGLGAPLGFSRGEHQASHKVWGSVLDATGRYGPLDLD